jgi:hypothetical protein
MAFNWSEYENNDTQEAKPLLVSEMSQQLVLASMLSLDSRSAWLDVDDSTWDTIDAAIAEAYEELTEEQTLATDNKAFTLELEATTSALASGSWQRIPFTHISKNDDELALFMSNQIWILESGEYRVTMSLSVRNAAGGVSYKAVRLWNDTQSVEAVTGNSTLLSASGIERAWFAMDDIFECNANNKFELQLYATAQNTTIEADAIAGITQPPCARAVFEKIR